MDKKLLALSGVFAVKKPAGESSAQTLERLKKALLNAVFGGSASADGNSHQARRRLLKMLKVGHGGTLDPMASGVLVVGLNGGCKQLAAYLSGTKKYVASARLGEHFDTLDITGKQISVDDAWHDKLPQDTKEAREFIEAKLAAFIGPAVMQRPPAYSAIHVNGVRAYKLARQDAKDNENGSTVPSTASSTGPSTFEAEFDIPARPVAIHALKLGSCDLPEFELEMECGGGCYVRSVIRDVAAALGTVAVMTALRRIQQGALFTLDAVVPETDWCDLEKIGQAIKDASKRIEQ